MRALALILFGLCLGGCGPLLIGAVGSSVAIDQCVEKEAEICEEANDLLQGE